MYRASLLHRFKSLIKTSRCQIRYLRIHEYQAQDLLAKYGLPVPRGRIATSPAEVANYLDEIGGRGVIKSQVLAGGRSSGTFSNGFNGGVHIASSSDEGRHFSSKMLGQRLFTEQTPPEGLPVDKVYVVEHLNIGHDFNLTITTDRSSGCPMLIMSHGGSTSIEELAAKDSNATVKVPLDYAEGVTEETILTLCERFALDQEQLTPIVRSLFTFFKECDATHAAINPLISDSESGFLVCAGSRVSIDDAASKRQSQIFSLRDKSQEMAVEIEAEKHGLVYIQLEGNIGCLVNGAGLAMATNDAVAVYGGSCANFLDGGGQATKETMVKAFELILSDTRVNTILVNIYGGITRCDMIAESIIAAAHSFHDIPIVVRLQGTNSAAGQQLIAESGLNLFAEDEFGNAVKKAIELAASIPTPEGAVSEAMVGSRGSSKIKSTSTSQRSFRSFSSSCPQHMSNTIQHAQPNIRRGMATTTADYASRPTHPSTISNLNIGQNIKVIYQGFTGKAATSNAIATLAYGTHIIGGVSPSITSSSPHPNPSLSHLPVFPTLRTALASLPSKPHATAVLVPALHAAAAILEAIEAEIPLIVSVAEHVPLHDMFRVQAALRTQSASRLVGPNCPGIIAPLAKCRIGIMPHLQYHAGCVGIVSKSGTLSYEAVGATTKAGLGQSLCIGVGGDMLPGTSLREGLEALLRDEGTKGIVLLGEIGGEAELEAAAFLQEWKRDVVRMGGKRKPVVGMITGKTAPRGKVMGHAGAVAGGFPTAYDKIRALEAAGVTIAVHPGEIGNLMRALLEKEGLFPMKGEE
ncbi:MAG: hypothetical protein L6R36_006729 [Xanthoria steineri]|nr:MAG: hypothetical protein L6R36_006729 [Xanthoria steineri]